ncbi:hypothetical protein [Thermostichus vulcanus]|uniref:Uncharacterized protein n=1 Tax=Thermostichus vulcanus str. 'Rupite' TaxID=2813851 RepID=A0ABT0CB65_THEVL|nr:hypothetical protein [Thermostichus vulcanus]MCJ2543033.1 hypothetical protein [Thermostichus vulcanus str. 'Rupite']
MRWPDAAIKKRAKEVLAEYKLTPEQILQGGTRGQINQLRRDPSHYMRFGPWWPRVRALLLKYQGEDASFCADWGGDPDFLAHYTYGDDFLDWVAAFEYLDRDGDLWDRADKPHSITLPDGSRALYSPGVGLIDD